MRTLLAMWVLVWAAQSCAWGAGGYPPVERGRPLVFPADTGAHPQFRTEWWYATGWLEEEGGPAGVRVERGFQVTFFRVRTLLGETNPSRFAPRQLIFAHAAIADPARGRLLHAERVDRALQGLAGADTGRTHVWLGEWVLSLDGGAYTTRIQADDFAFAFTLTPTRAPVLNGHRGFSQKAPDPRNASYYYILPQLEVTGSLTLEGTAREVRGRAWLDHEWSSEILPPEAKGWDWIGVNLHDGGSLMAFQMRGTDERPLWAAATLTNSDGELHTLAPDEVRFSPGRTWQSPRTGASYPVAWTVVVGEREFELVPLMDDQELDSRASTGAIYWEGAIRVLEHGAEVGRGYLEMTGYAARLSM